MSGHFLFLNLAKTATICRFLVCFHVFKRGNSNNLHVILIGKLYLELYRLHDLGRGAKFLHDLGLGAKIVLYYSTLDKH